MSEEAKTKKRCFHPVEPGRLCCGVLCGGIENCNRTRRENASAVKNVRRSDTARRCERKVFHRHHVVGRAAVGGVVFGM